MQLSNEFLEKYKNVDVPFGGLGLGEVVFLRTYTRWIPELNRREEWREVVKRVVEYSINLDPNPDIVEAENLYDNIFNLRVFPAGRTLWIGGTEAAKKYPMANFNCSFRVIDDYEAFWEIFYLLMLGCGTGFRILPSDVDKLPSLATYVELRFVSKEFIAHKNDVSFLTYDTADDITINVGDSKEGWIDALHYYFNLLQGIPNRININTYGVRAKGAILKTFGGRASGPEGLKEMFTNIHKVIMEAPKVTYNKVKLRPIDALDILNNIAYNVVSGGVRRSSQIALFDINDKEVLNAKIGVYEKGHLNYGKYWRAMSNNSIFFTDKPNNEQLLDIFSRIEQSGEPGFVNSKAAEFRRANFQGINPCAEILLDNKGVCNLTEINLMNMIVEDYHDYPVIDWSRLDKAIFHAVHMGLRMTLLNLELPEWDRVQKRDRLIGVSLTGVQDAFDKLGITNINIIEDFLEKINAVANSYADEYADELKITRPLLVTTIKPSGTVSQLPTVSSGVHRSFAPYYIRRIRVTSTDPIANVVKILNYPVFPETSQGPNRAEFLKLDYKEQEIILDKADTWVVEFPVKTDAKIASNDESAIIQFDRYLLFNEYYTDHNTSITITFAPEEVNDLVNHILKNWDNYVAVSFLKKDITYYNLLPYEAITEEEYNKRKNDIIDTSLKELLNTMETGILDDALDPSCATGVCAVR